MLINTRVLNRIKKGFFLLFFLSFILPLNLCATDSNLETTNLVSAAKRKEPQRKNKGENYTPYNSWKPYYTWIGNAQNQESKMFIQSSMGLGFLYFSDVSGNIKSAPEAPNQSDAGVSLQKGVGDINYNRTPIYEFMFGRRLYNWLKVMASVQTQEGVNIQTGYVTGAPDALSDNAGDTYYQLRANLDLYAVQLKVNFELPWVLIWKNWMYTPYFGAGVGAGWQSWTDIIVYQQFYNGSDNQRYTFGNTLNQKYSANCVWMADAGFRMKPASPKTKLSFVLGCKYNQWGQARSIGKIDQQVEWNQGLRDPLTVKVVYSFAPYFGGQWNF